MRVTPKGGRWIILLDCFPEPGAPQRWSNWKRGGGDQCETSNWEEEVSEARLNQLDIDILAKTFKRASLRTDRCQPLPPQ